ncbi:MAG TPA: acetolactate synthase small subunit [Acidobacteriota bacterium]|nr:acetolactate synthase small subunit [Acidobacteriota bacterium]
MVSNASQQQTLVLLVRPGADVVGRVTGLLRSRQVSLQAISVSRTADACSVQLTLVIGGDADDALRVTKQLARLIQVQHVENMGSRPHVARDLALIKVAGVGDNRLRVTEICDQYRARIIDESPGAMIVEASGEAGELDRLTEQLEPLGVLEVARHGPLAMGGGERTLQEAIQVKPA